MIDLEIKDKITRNKAFNASVKERKERLIQKGVDLSGKCEKGFF